MQNELIERAKSGDCEAIKILINKSFSARGISVKSIRTENETLMIELRSLKGPIEEKILEKIRSSTQQLGIVSVKNVDVFQFQNKTHYDLRNNGVFSGSSQGSNTVESENSLIRLVNQVYENNSSLKKFGMILFALGFALMGIGFFYDPSYGDTYNIGAISFKATYTNTGGFISICGAIFMASSRS